MDVFEWLAWLQSHTDVEWHLEGCLIRTIYGCCPISVVERYSAEAVSNVIRAWGWPESWANEAMAAADGGFLFYPFIRQTLLAACRLPPEADGV